jgi:hypothetical protein
MKVNYREVRRVAWQGALCGLLIMLVMPFIGGAYYSMTGPHDDEQVYVDLCVHHLKSMRAACPDPELQGILDYTIQRYNHVGPWDIMVMPLQGQGPGGKVIGCNCPWCPGISLDPCNFLYPPEDTALVILHEAMHDYYPCFGHSFHEFREPRFYDLSYAVRRHERIRRPFLF